MKREIIRVEPFASYLEKYKAPISTATRHGGTIYITGAPPFEPDTGEICAGPIRCSRRLTKSLGGTPRSTRSRGFSSTSLPGTAGFDIEVDCIAAV